MPEKITLDSFTAVKRGPRGPRERTDEQKGYDADVLEAYETGAPLAYQVEADEKAVKALEAKVRGSVDFHKLGARRGEFLPSKKKGYVIVQWQIKARTHRPRKPKTSDE